MEENNRTIKYIIEDENFRYHFKKCKMDSNKCIISKAKHPIKEVELLKAKLLETGKLREYPDGYKLKRDFSTGPLMAYNLCSSVVKKDFSDINTEVVINGNSGEDVDIKEYFEIPHVIASNSEYAKLLRKYELKLLSIEKYQFNEAFFNGHRVADCDYSQNEQFVVNSLTMAGVLKNYRRGDVKEKEADIVDEEHNRQIEVVSCFNKTSNVIRYTEKMPMEAAVLDSIKTGHYALPDGVMDKFYEKNYTDKYELELAILFIGSKATVSEMLSLIKKEIEENPNIKNDFKATHIIVIDPVKDLILCLSPGHNATLNLKDNPIGVYRKTDADIEQLHPNESCLMICEHIFDKHEEIAMLSAEEIKQMINDYRIWK